jgi:hypothetical protein
MIAQNIAISTSIKTAIVYNQALKDYIPISAQTIDYGTTQQVTVVLTNKETKHIMQTTGFYNKTTNTASIFSIKPTTGEKGVAR